MTRQHTPLQQLKEAKQIAKDYGLRIAECRTPNGTDYVVYRRVPGGDTRLGKRSTPDGLRRFVARCANFH